MQETHTPLLQAALKRGAVSCSYPPTSSARNGELRIGKRWQFWVIGAIKKTQMQTSSPESLHQNHSVASSLTVLWTCYRSPPSLFPAGVTRRGLTEGNNYTTVINIWRKLRNEQGIQRKTWLCLNKWKSHTIRLWKRKNVFHFECLAFNLCMRSLHCLHTLLRKHWL